MNRDQIYRSIGEFAVCFQWLENRFREIGWLILDPNRTDWPPKSLRKESNCKLLTKVESLYTAHIEKLGVGDERKASFSVLISKAHALRVYRNNLLHSAFIELEAGGEVLGILRSNPKLTYDSECGEPQFDQEILSEASIRNKLVELAELALALNVHYVQLTHWATSDKKSKSASQLSI